MQDNLSTGVVTYECKVEVDGLLEGELQDWPANIQDGIFAALERKSQEVELPLCIVYCACKNTYNDDGIADGYYIHVVASEIVVRDTRFSSASAMKKAFDEIVKRSGGWQ